MVVGVSFWSLLTGGCCSEVVLKAGLTVLQTGTKGVTNLILFSVAKSKSPNVRQFVLIPACSNASKFRVGMSELGQTSYG